MVHYFHSYKLLDLPASIIIIQEDIHGHTFNTFRRSLAGYKEKAINNTVAIFRVNLKKNAK